ncbi:hypothetical protein GCM10007880_65380 [Mesorhizobium amorphae]|uniref:hypothetical protein n=1 Tax=Mesorhizobium amorphae TaxID=71433 RepID=UPI00235D43F0|nr:hypothetical protein [Mesorhizobium amorphae]GLR46020.1 hypothetical protein GCM10007880_65380 [Mesorhizobium amorphae]
MVKLPSYPVPSGSASYRPTIEDRASATDPAIVRANNKAIDGAISNSDKKRASRRRETRQTPGMPLEFAISGVPEVSRVDPVARVSSNEMRAPIDVDDPRAELVALYGHNLAREQLSFVTPRLRHPDVLRAEKRCFLLERLVEGLSAAPENWIARDGMAVLKDELLRLILLRQNRNSLIEG